MATDQTYDEYLFDENLVEAQYVRVRKQQERLEDWFQHNNCSIFWFKHSQYGSIEEYKSIDGTFADLSSCTYIQKLLYIEHVAKAYFVGFYQFHKDDAKITIRPTNKNELFEYNRWMIERWRVSILNNNLKTEGTYTGFYELKERFLLKFNKMNARMQALFIEDQFTYIQEFLKRSKVDTELIERVFICIKSGNHDDLYNTEYHANNTLIEIACVWDILKYKAELTVYYSKNKFKHKRYKKVNMVKLDDSQIALLFNWLSGKYISSDTLYIDFKRMILQKSEHEVVPIKWIIAEDNRTVVNKVPLIQLMSKLIIGKPFEINGFIIRYFQTSIVGETKNISRPSLGYSRRTIARRLRANEPVSPQERDILNFLNDHLDLK